MTKKELELENQFLKLQLKVISILADSCCGADRDEIFKNLGKIASHTDYKASLDAIKINKLPYNFFNADITI